MNNWKLRDIYNEILDIEKKYNLLNKSIKGVFFWKFFRIKLFSQILQELDLYNQAHDEIKKKTLGSRLQLLYNALRFGPLTNRKNRDILIFEHPRKIFINNTYIDIYTYYFVKDFFSNYNYEIIDLPYLRKHFFKPNERRSYGENILLHYRFYYYTFLRFNKKEKELISNIETEIYKRFGLKISLFDSLRKYLVFFKADYKFYNKLLRVKRPKLVILVVSYGLEALIAACKNNNISVVEIQHGTMSKYHLGYSFVNNESNVPYFPDILWMFGKYWYDSTPLPISEDKVKYIGFPFLEYNLKKYKNYNKSKKTIVFISQGTIGEKLSKIAYYFALKNPEYRVIYKLHPGEFIRWKNYYFLKMSEKLDNFSIVLDEENLYKLFSEAEYVIGVYSTAIYEAIALNSKPIIVKLPGWEYMEYLINKNYAKLVSNEEEILEAIMKNNFRLPDRDYFFKKYHKEILKDIFV